MMLDAMSTHDADWKREILGSGGLVDFSCERDKSESYSDGVVMCASQRGFTGMNPDNALRGDDPIRDGINHLEQTNHPDVQNQRGWPR
jgi:hypothetical protein